MSAPVEASAVSLRHLTNPTQAQIDELAALLHQAFEGTLSFLNPDLKVAQKLTTHSTSRPSDAHLHWKL